MNALDVLDAITAVSGKNDKRTLLRANANDQELKDLLDAAFNYKRRFYIKKWQDQPPSSLFETDRAYDFNVLLSKLESQKFRGDAATQLVEVFLRTCSARQQEWYSKVIRQDLKAGFSVDSAIDCGFDIPLFEVQLAKDGNECKKLPEMIKAGVMASKKLDGYRDLAVVHNGECVQYTRNGTVFENFPGIAAELAERCAGGSFVFDGEIMSDGFAATQKSAFASKRKTVVGDMKYHIFDMIPYDEWISENFKTPAFTRYANLDKFFAEKVAGTTNLIKVAHTPIVSIDDIAQLEAQYIAEGYEGVMINPNIPYYKGKKSNKMLKFKTFVSMDCEVVGAHKGDALSKYKDVLGKFTVRQENGVLCDVGSGYEDDERDELWNSRAEMIGRIMEVKYQNLTEDDKKMRFPTFVRWRDMGANQGKI